MTKLLALLLFVFAVPTHAALVDKATCRADCAAFRAALDLTTAGPCVKIRQHGPRKGQGRIRHACALGVLVLHCRHHKSLCGLPTTTTTTTTTTCPQGQTCTQPMTHTLTLTVPPTGSDLDTGVTGVSHNFPVINGSTLQYILSCPDGEHCTGTAQTGVGTPNGTTFGAPLPLLAGGVPVCVVNRFQDPTLTGTFDIVTGVAGTNTIKLFSDLYVTQTTEVCPRCTIAGGGDIGSTGKCSVTAKHPNAPCTVNGKVAVAGTNYLLSSDCGPGSGFTTTLDIILPLTTGQAPPLVGPLPCKSVGQSADDNCGGTACNATCTGPACATKDASGQCIDAKGGISQLCCANNPTTACFPTSAASKAAGGGSIIRTGVPVVPGDPNGGKFAATFCIDATGSSLVNITSGLPGPGALLLPSVAQLTTP